MFYLSDLLFHSLKIIIFSEQWKDALTLGHTRKVITPPWYKGGLIDPPPPLEFLIHCNISKRFCLQWKAFDLLSTRWGIFYWWWRCWRSVTSPNMVAISAAILDFIKNWIQVKTVRISFLRLTCKITKIITLHHFIHKLYFYSWKKLKKTYFLTQKRLDHLLLMTSYLVTIVTDHH